MSADIKLVCFDLGGVLIRICRSWEEGCRAAGIDVRGEIATDLASAKARRELGMRHQVGLMDCEDYFKAVAATHGDRYTAKEIERVHHAWMLGEYPGVSEVIDRIHKAGVATAALSNTNLSHWRRLPGFASVGRLHTRLASHELGLVKPDAAIYREAERRLGVGGDAILFFDDLIENVEAANKVGWNAVRIDHNGDTAAQIAEALCAREVI
jgi:putative hydrolase of the HAD superfamily